MVLKKITLIIITLLLVNVVQGKNSSYIYLKAFLKKNRFKLEINIQKESFILKNNLYKIHFLLNSRSTIVKGLNGKQQIWLLDYPITTKNGRIILPKMFIHRLKSLKTKYANPAYKAKDKNTKIKFILIDPGHGGKDPGNINNGIKEKHINLSIAKRVKKLLQRSNPNIPIILTRQDDRFLSLEKRNLMAIKLTKSNNHGLFVSIHANASLNKDSYGIETFFYSSKVNDKRKDRITYITKLVKPLSYNKEARSIITQMYNLEISKESYRLAELVNNELYKKVKRYTINRGIKARKPFFVITYNNLPSILVEVGFLSNKKEAKYIKTRTYQNNSASGIAKGISMFIKEFNKTKGFIR